MPPSSRPAPVPPTSSFPSTTYSTVNRGPVLYAALGVQVPFQRGILVHLETTETRQSAPVCYESSTASPTSLYGGCRRPLPVRVCVRACTNGYLWGARVCVGTCEGWEGGGVCVVVSPGPRPSEGPSEDTGPKGTAQTTVVEPLFGGPWLGVRVQVTRPHPHRFTRLSAKRAFGWGSRKDEKQQTKDSVP